MRRICVFAGSNLGRSERYRQAAEELGRLLLARDLGLVYGGGCVGLMGVIADEVLAGGGEVIGVIPRFLAKKEVLHETVPDMRIVDSMHDRKASMAELADGFIALPGGMGTLEELCETLTWAQLGLHGKPCGLLDAGGYYRRLVGALDHCVEEGFLRPEHRSMLLVEERAGPLLDRMERYRAPAVHKWMDLDET